MLTWPIHCNKTVSSPLKGIFQFRRRDGKNIRAQNLYKIHVNSCSSYQYLIFRCGLIIFFFNEKLFNMKFVVVFATLFAVTAAALLPYRAASPESQAYIVSQFSNISPELGTYSYA